VPANAQQQIDRQLIEAFVFQTAFGDGGTIEGLCLERGGFLAEYLPKNWLIEPSSALISATRDWTSLPI